jgi:hypothetical protein
MNRYPFTSVPYQVTPGVGESTESSARSRGFKFALISGLAAYLAKANQVIVSESGQGSLGPVLVTVGQAYEDYRTHPLFTERMEKFLGALLNHQVVDLIGLEQASTCTSLPKVVRRQRAV